MRAFLSVFALVLLTSGFFGTARAQDRFAELDKKVQAFLERHRGTWRDLNVPESDGRVLHNIILKHKYTRALEIGTSTGHSGVWMAWALAKTGGSLTTVEIDPRRRQTALANFKEAGLASYIDARLGNAHEIVPALPGPFERRDLHYLQARDEGAVNTWRAVSGFRHRRRLRPAPARRRLPQPRPEGV